MFDQTEQIRRPILRIVLVNTSFAKTDRPVSSHSRLLSQKNVLSKKLTSWQNQPCIRKARELQMNMLRLVKIECHNEHQSQDKAAVRRRSLDSFSVGQGPGGG